MNEISNTSRPIRRHLLPRWCGFWVGTCILVVSVTMEAIHSFFAAMAFFVTRRRQRQRIHNLMLSHQTFKPDVSNGKRAISTRPGRSVGSLALVVIAVACAAGCESAPFPGGSFKSQIDSFNWSAKAMFRNDATFIDVYNDFDAMFIADSPSHFPQSFELLGW